jgi:hypothetical protein
MMITQESYLLFCYHIAMLCIIIILLMWHLNDKIIMIIYLLFLDHLIYVILMVSLTCLLHRLMLTYQIFFSFTFLIKLYIIWFLLMKLIEWNRLTAILGII